MRKKIFAFIAMCLLVAGSAFGQSRTVTGQVISGSDDEPLIGVAILVQGTNNGTATDLDGNFTLQNVPANATLVVSYVGFTTQEVKATSSKMTIVLKEDTELLNEVVVIGYGVQKKSDLTGAVASVKESDLKNRAVTDAAAALQGKAAGIQILNNSGAPGTGAQIRVRGYSSNSGNIGPLLIVDGLKVDNIQYLDPSMIESMEVLKDAASAAIYGAEAGNGVILITTKKGTEGHATISYDGKFTLQSLGKKAQLFDGDEYVEYQKYIGSITDNDLTANGYVPGTNYDWFDAVFENSWAQQHAITAQGGNDKGHFFLSLNYLNNDGIIKSDKDTYTRLTAQINADYQIKKWFNITTNNSIEKWKTKSVSQSAYGSMLNAVMSIDPLTPAYYSTIEECAPALQSQYKSDPSSVLRDPEHNNDFYATSRYLEEATGNPLAQRDRTDAYSGGLNVRGNIAANLTPVKGLTVTSRLGYRIGQNSSHSYAAPYWLTSMAKDTKYHISADVNTNYYYQWENFANYLGTFGKHELGAMIGMSYIENNYDNAHMAAESSDQCPNIMKDTAPNFRYMDYVVDNATKSYSNAPGRSASLAYFGRLTYSYDNRYSLQVNFRADAFDSSKLSAENRWGYFPSFSAGWTISNERFIKDNISRDAMSFLKLRASWGRNGNVNSLSPYQYSTSIGLNAKWYQFNPAAGTGIAEYGSTTTGLANPDLKWETSEQWDLGLDARFLSDRLSFGMDWYRKTTKDLLVQITPVPEIGVASSWINAGNVLNTGFEFELGWKDRIGDFRYSINANLATLHNEVLALSSVLPRILGTGGGVSGLNYQIRTAIEPGYALWYFRGYKSAGIDKETGKPLYYNAKGEVVTDVTDNDAQYIGQSIPDVTYGITLNFEYKGFDLNIYGAGVAGNEIFSLLNSADRPRTNTLNVYNRNSWKQAGDDAEYANMALVKSDWKYWSSSGPSIFSGSFFKFKQIQLGYTLPKSITKKALIENLRLSVSLDDFFTITNYPGCDPETATTGNARDMGYDCGTYPTSKKVVFGINVTF